ncbi:MAG: ABC transporter ATP-binding protein [Candidatus Omnitrophica bacterium]|nr:ABC transporter ATP-binding protein [Candidatus Omnitrophota bacterium]
MDRIVFCDLWAMYRIKFIIDSKPKWENFWALKGINFKVEQGEVVGIIGENGAGKSTILKIIAGMISSDRGQVQVSGRISGLLELGAGFQPELTGSENIYLIAGLFGLSRLEVESIYEEILSFADIGKFINAPVKCYSQGMFVRLAFAIAINVNSDIILIDDTLAVGDEYFQKKCIKKIFELKDQGKTIIFVTHDMEVVRRLCQRAIFLKDGKIVKDGPVNQAIPLYAQTSGAKEGVGILKSGHLSIIFNNGRLLFNWKDRLLTPGLGGHTILGIMNKQYNSTQADWLVEKQDDQKIIAKGKFNQLNVEQTWQIEIDKDLGLKWDIGIKSSDREQVSECQANIMLVKEYGSWSTGIEKGDFPITEQTNKAWQHLLGNNIFRKVIGVDMAAGPDFSLPSLFFERSSSMEPNSPQILNTDYLFNCRMLQYKISGLNNLLTFQQNSADLFSGKIIFDVFNQESYFEQINQDFILSSKDTSLIFANGEAILSYKGLSLTKNSHLNTSINIAGKWYDSACANWEFKRQAQNLIVGFGSWPGLLLKQVWEFEIHKEGAFLWKVWLQVEKETDIQQQRLQFMCTGKYRNFFTEYSGGEFSDKFFETESDMLQRCVSTGTIGLSGQDDKLPVLSLSFSPNSGNFAKILNSDFYHKARILRIEKIDPEEETIFKPGRYKSFEIEARLDAAKELQKNNLPNAIEKGRLKFIFDRGKGSVFWEGRELTKKLGFYTSLRSCGRWHDSVSSADWKIEGQDNSSIRVKGKWLHLPISQVWKLNLPEEGVIEFNVFLEVNEKIVFERLQANLMLLEKYTDWVAKENKGKFPVFAADITDDWQQVYRADSKFIGVFSKPEKKVLPEILFAPLSLKADWSLNILNSDLYHRGRVLQFLNANNTVLEPGQHPYAHGLISVAKKTDV